ncbi:hypothetical protein C8R43DRAFT_940878 [Mycena crocata]|nr:hypothetical protein C8R43DRAFT_940878 [Mycena crocata]
MAMVRSVLRFTYVAPLRIAIPIDLPSASPSIWIQDQPLSGKPGPASRTAVALQRSIISVLGTRPLWRRCELSDESLSATEAAEPHRPEVALFQMKTAGNAVFKARSEDSTTMASMTGTRRVALFGALVTRRQTPFGKSAPRFKLKAARLYQLNSGPVVFNSGASISITGNLCQQLDIRCNLHVLCCLYLRSENPFGNAGD